MVKSIEVALSPQIEYVRAEFAKAAKDERGMKAATTTARLDDLVGEQAQGT